MGSLYGVPVVYWCDASDCDEQLYTQETFAIDAEQALFKAEWAQTDWGDFCPKHSLTKSGGD